MLRTPLLLTLGLGLARAVSEAGSPPGSEKSVEEETELERAKLDYETQMQYQGSFPQEAASLKREYEAKVAKIKAEYSEQSAPAKASLLLAAPSTGAAPNAEEVVASRTKQVLDSMRRIQQEALALEKDLPQVERRIDEVPRQVGSAMRQERERLSRDFEAKIAKANLSEEDMQDLQSAKAQLDALDTQELRKLRTELDNAAKPALQSIKQFKGNASLLQGRAHSVLDLMYGMGDAAEDIADKLNDEIGDGEQAILDVANRVEDKINDHVNKICEDAQEELQNAARKRAASANSVEMKFYATSLFATMQVKSSLTPMVLVGTAVLSASVASAVTLAVVRNTRMSREPLLGM